MDTQRETLFVMCENRWIPLGGRAHEIFVSGILPGVARCVAMIAGCDYRKGLPLFGVSNALKILLEFVKKLDNLDLVGNLFLYILNSGIN